MSGRPPQILPALRLDSDGRARVDYRAILAFAFPLMLNSTVQVTLTLVDLWFIGRISTAAVSAAGAVQWFIPMFTLVLGCASLTTQPLVAQFHGAGRYRRSTNATWTALWGTIFAAPAFLVVAASGRFLLAPFGFDVTTESLALEFWFPRMAGAVLGAAAASVMGYFTGIGRPSVTIRIIAVTAMANAVLNEIFIFHLDWGIAGSGWATTVSQGAALSLAIRNFLEPRYRRAGKTHLTWIPRTNRIMHQLRFGLPMGLASAADLLGFSIFLMMQVRLGTISGAASQIASTLTVLAYIPGLGVASTGTTLVGQSMGARDPKWAMIVGTRVILLTALLTGTIGIALALFGPVLLKFFVSSDDAAAADVVILGTYLMWLAAGYQFFDGLALGCIMCLRGAGDATVPAMVVLPVSWLFFLPLTHSFTFPPGDGWYTFLPQFGWGAIGGWIALIVYVTTMGSLLYIRWSSGAWLNNKSAAVQRF